MADKDTKPASAPAATDAAPASEPLTLQEFCIRLSSRDGRVEMIAGFEHGQRSLGIVKATEDEFQAAFDAFTTKPTL